MRVLGRAAICAVSAFLASGCAVHSSRSYRALHFVSFLNSGPPPVAQCRTRGELRYCVHTAPKEAEEDLSSILYFLHYAGGSEKSWEELPFSRVYYAYFRRRNLPVPKVVSISYGPYWTLSDARSETGEALFPAFLQRDMPFIEEELGTPKRRYLWGMSQGGLNAARLILRRPEMFDGAILSCPALYSLSIYAPEEQLRAYALRTKADFDGSVMWGIKALLPWAGGPQAWRMEDPLNLAKEADHVPPILIQANRRDEFGFFEGAEIFYRELKRKRQSVTFKPHFGGHCVVGITQAVRWFREIRY